MMKLTTILLGIFIGLIFYCRAEKDKPSWINYSHRTAKYQKSIYVSGFASEENIHKEDVSELLERVKSHARTQLVQSIHVSIKSITMSDVVVNNKETDNFFKQSSVSISNIQITGLKSETYYDEKNDIAYAFTFAKKQDISQLYRKSISNTNIKLQNKLSDADQFIEANNNQSALQYLFECVPLFRDIEEAQTLIIYFENANIDAPYLYVNETKELKQAVFNKIYSLQKSKNLTLDDAIFFLAHGLKLQLKNISDEIQLSNITYQNTSMGSVFSYRLTDKLEQQLIKQNLTIIKQQFVKNQESSSPPKLIITGTYWEEGENIRIICTVRNMESGKSLASAESLLPKKWLINNNIAFTPNNFEEAEKQAVDFSKNEIDNSGLSIDITTNKGKDNLIFVEGQDTMRFFVKTNRQCYIRIIYYLADKSKVLMLDNFYIDRTKVNNYYELPDKFVVAAPFGVELLQLNAQTKPFDPLHINEQGGYQFILDDNTKILANTRGFKPVEDNSGVAEKRMTITTLSKYVTE